MFITRKGHPDNHVNFLPHETLPLGLLLQGAVIKINADAYKCNLGLRAMKQDTRNASPHYQEQVNTEGIQNYDVLLGYQYIEPQDTIGFHERQLSVYTVENSKPLLLRTVSSLDQTGSSKVVRRRKIEHGQAEIFLKYQDRDEMLYLSYLDYQGLCIQQFFKFPVMPDHFRVFTVGEVPAAHLQFQLWPFQGHDRHVKAVRIGNLVIREGDMFNADPVLNSNVLILPASEEGTVSQALQLRISEMEMPMPDPGPAGALHFLRKPKDNVFLAYAYSVKDDTSNQDIISSICKGVNELILDIPKTRPYKIHGINMPLLGTGAGGLDPVKVLGVYIRMLNAKIHQVPIIVSIPSPEIYKKVTEVYYRQSIEVLHEFQQDQPHQVAQLEIRLGLKLPYPSYEVDSSGRLISLGLQNMKLNNKIALIRELKTLRSLVLNHSEFDNLDFLASMTGLRYLYLRGTWIRSFAFLERLSNLVTLDLSESKDLPVLQIFRHIPKIKRLSLAYNQLTDIRFLGELHNLETLDLAHNQIFDLRPLANLLRLVSISIPGNQVSDIGPLLHLPNLRYLDISDNQVNHLSYQLITDKLQYLRFDKNPFFEYGEAILNEGENHLKAIRNFLLRQREKDKVVIKLPAKVLLMGNHASGKTSLLNYVIEGKLSKTVKSTHIIQIKRLYDSEDPDLPIAMFYDFGGQDYYHGIYRAFLTGGAINLILWNPKNNYNQKRLDSNKRLTQDFKLDYWVAQKQYLENEKYSDQFAPVLLIQTHADQQGKIGHRLDCEEHSIQDEFVVCLSGKKQNVSEYALDVQQKSLKYLRSSINALIRGQQIQREEPRWYIDFLKFILEHGAVADHKPIKVKDLLPHYKREVVGKLELLQDDLEQLFRQGLILYYAHDMPDLVWLNPVAVVDYVHAHMLHPDIIAMYNGLVPQDLFREDKELVELLIKQKVIFLHEPSSQYIIPNFLGLAEQNSNEFELYTFGMGDPLFTLKFKNFLPFGLINQVICFFGDLPEEKKFWRDRLIFTLERKAKIMISINFQLLEIRVHAAFLKGVDRSFEEQVKKYLFYGILGLYWDLDLLKFEDYIAYLNGGLKETTFAEEDPLLNKVWATQNFYENVNCRPVDLMISLNEKDFVSYRDLCDYEGSVMINSFSKNEAGGLDTIARSIPVFPFQAFTPSTLNRRKNVAISYSKKDLEMVNKFKDYLKPLYDDELINHPWYCTELIAGTDWDEEIKKKFDAADIIFFMISENLMVTNYVLENEIKNAIDKYNRGEKIKIVPILLVPYRFQRKGNYDLSRFSSLPYTLKPVTMFDNQLEAWHIISESIRIMIEKDIDPGKPDALSTELRSAFEKVVRQNKTKG